MLSHAAHLNSRTPPPQLTSAILPRPAKISLPTKRPVVLLACGAAFTLAALGGKEGGMLVWGDNACGQLAMDPATVGTSEGGGGVDVVDIVCEKGRVSGY